MGVWWVYRTSHHFSVDFLKFLQSFIESYDFSWADECTENISTFSSFKSNVPCKFNSNIYADNVKWVCCLWVQKYSLTKNKWSSSFFSYCFLFKKINDPSTLETAFLTWSLLRGCKVMSIYLLHYNLILFISTYPDLSLNFFKLLQIYFCFKYIYSQPLN